MSKGKNFLGDQMGMTIVLLVYLVLTGCITLWVFKKGAAKDHWFVAAGFLCGMAAVWTFGLMGVTVEYVGSKDPRAIFFAKVTLSLIGLGLLSYFAVAILASVKRLSICGHITI